MKSDGVPKRNAVPAWLRVVLVMVGIGIFAVSVGLAFQWPWAKALWPITDSRLSYIFLGSIGAAIAGPVIWIGATGELGAAESGAFDLLVTYFAAAGFFTVMALQSPEALANKKSAVGPGTHFVYAIGALLLGAIAVCAWMYSRRFDIGDQRKMPTFVRISFAAFALILSATGLALLLGVQHVFPWPLTAPSSVLFGIIFLGAACYFVYGLFQPSWHHAKGQLIGFLLYDLFLLWPFVRHFQTVKPEHRMSLVVYTSALVVSALIAIYYLFIARTTRFWRPVAAD